jgi:hypothetical protein
MAFRRLHQAFKHLRSPAQSARSFSRRRPRAFGHAGLGGRYGLEQLEQRVLLTTVRGGDVFEYREGTDPENGDVIRVRLQGNITAELIGAQVDRRDNTVTLVNLPGELNGTPVFGGLTVAPGSQLLGTIATIIDVDGDPLPGTPNITALAAAGPDTFYGFNVRSIGGSTFIRLVLLTLPAPDAQGNRAGPVIGTVISDPQIIPDIFLEDGTLITSNVTAADISEDGQIFYVISTGSSSRLFSIDPSEFDPLDPTSVSDVRQSVTPRALIIAPAANPQAGQQGQSIGTIFFVDDPAGGETLYGIRNGGQGAQGSEIGVVSLVDDLSFQGTPITTLGAGGGGGGTGNITGADINPVTGQIVAVQSGETAGVFDIQTSGAGSLNLGPLDLNNASGLTFTPGVQDPFTNSQIGSFIAVQGASLYYVNPVDRFPAQYLFNVFVTESDLSGDIAIGYVRGINDTTFPDPFVIRPFEGDVDQIQVNNTRGGPDIFVSPPESIGGVLLGAITQDIVQPSVDEQNRIIPAQPVPSDVNFGVLPSDVTILNSGLIVERGNDIGRFLLGGTIIGQVDVRGNMDLFYAGWVITGTDNGESSTGSTTLPDNFNVDGDLRSLLSTAAIGTNDASAAPLPTFVSGFDLRVGGTLGTMRSIQNGFIGTVEVNHLEDANTPHIGRNQFESESHSLALESGFEVFNLGSNAQFHNDTYDTAEYLGSFASDELLRGEVIRVEGTLEDGPTNDDEADYYAVALMAGQTVTLRLRENTNFINDDDPNTINEDNLPGSSLALGVFDPDGRLIATDYNNTQPVETRQQFFTFTADRPGIYRLAVANVGNAPGFDNAGGQLVDISDRTYTITAVGVGDIGIGGIVTQNNIFDNADFTDTAEPGIQLFRGDLGAIKSYNAAILSDAARTVEVALGDLRTMDAVNIGQLFVRDPQIAVPEGSVGLLRASGTALVLNFNSFLEEVPAIGGDYQLIDGPAATVAVELIANGNIGVIRAGDMASPGASVLEVNADDTGDAGVIDLIDVAGDFGTFGSGGPEITTNTRGNVRYIRVGGIPYRDLFFGNSGAETTNGSPGQAVTITDDSGSRIRFSAPGNPVPNPNFNPLFPNAGLPEFIGARISLITYPIRGSGGSVVINATSESGMTIAVEGGPVAEVGRVEIAGLGRAVLSGIIEPDTSDADDNLDGVQFVANDVVDDADSPTGTRQSLVLDPRELTADSIPPNLARMSPDDLFLRITGGARVDVLNVVVIDNGAHENLDVDGNAEVADLGDEDVNRPVALGNAISIINETEDGEIVNVVAATVGELVSRGNLGLARSSTGTTVEGIDPLTVGGSLAPRTPASPRPARALVTADAVGLGQPFLSMREGIAIAGNVISMRAGKAIGNIVVNGGSINELIANADNVDDPNQFEGINGTTYAQQGTTDVFALPGRVNRVRIGEGVLPSGTGNFQRAGVVVDGAIGPITGENADIRGDFIARNLYLTLQTTEVTVTVNGVETENTRTVINPPHTPIESIGLTNGSIINADIFASTDPGDAREFVGRVGLDFADNFDDPDYEIGRILIRGNGGIIGTSVGGADINSIEIGNGGFGVFSSNISVIGDGTLNRLEASGYGIRQVRLIAARVNAIIANGDGTSLSTNAINERVRISETGSNDPLIFKLDPFFGFEANELTDIHQVLGTITTVETGLIDGERLVEVNPEIAGVTDTGIIADLDANGQRDLRLVRAWQIRDESRLDFGNSVGSLQVRDIINGLELTTGTIKSFNLKQDAFNLTINVAGRVKSINIQGSLANNSVIRTVGTGGQFDNVKIGGNLIGNIESSRAIKTITIGGDLTGNITVNAAGTALKTLKVGGAFLAGSLDIKGNVGTITSAGSLGSIGDKLTVDGNIGKIAVGGDLRSNIRVTGNLKTLAVKGSIVDGGIEDGLVIDVDNIITSLQVGGDIQPGVFITANAVKKQKIGGQNLGEIEIA